MPRADTPAMAATSRAAADLCADIAITSEFFTRSGAFDNTLLARIRGYLSSGCNGDPCRR